MAPLLQKDVVWCVVYAGSMRVPCGILAGCFGGARAGGPETGRNGRFTYKAKNCWFNYTFSMQRKRSRKELGRKWARKTAARKPQELCKKATREQQRSRKGSTFHEKNPPVKNKHDIVRTSASVKPRSLEGSTSQVVSGQARCAPKRQLRQQMFDSTNQDKENTFSISMRS